VGDLKTTKRTSYLAGEKGRVVTEDVPTTKGKDGVIKKNRSRLSYGNEGSKVLIVFGGTVGG